MSTKPDKDHHSKTKKNAGKKRRVKSAERDLNRRRLEKAKLQNTIELDPKDLDEMIDSFD